MRPLNVILDSDSGLENTLIAHFEGDFDGAAKENLDEIQVKIDSCAPGFNFIFDFSQLNYLNSFALGQMVVWHNLIESKGGKVIIVGTNDHVKDIFMVLGVDTIFKTYNTLEEAKIDLI